jgi:hypothetical protein
MNLVSELARMGCAWYLETTEIPVGDGRKQSQVLRLVLRQGKQGSPVARLFGSDSELTIDEMLVATLKEHFPAHPALQAWYAARGHVPVELESGALEALDGCIRASLQSQVNSRQSVITWNSLHLLHADDMHAVYREVALVLRVAFSNERAPTRIAVATVMRDALVALLQRRRREAGKKVALIQRDTTQEFALRMLSAGCELTSIEEWMYGWLAYIVRDKPAPAGAPVAAKPRVFEEPAETTWASHY